MGLTTLGKPYNLIHMAKNIYEMQDWETNLKVSELPNDGLKLVTGNGTPKGSLAVNLDLADVRDLRDSLSMYLQTKGIKE